MTRQILTLQPLLDRSVFFERGGLRGYQELLDEAGELFERANGAARPKALMVGSPVESAEADAVLIAGTRFESRCLANNLSGLSSTIVYVATCGIELDLLGAGVDALTAYWIDLVKELALEAILEEVNFRAASLFGSQGVATMNPGSADVDVWPIEQQKQLFGVLGDTEAEVGVTLTDSMLMIPNKSVSGVLFPARGGWISCQACTRTGCVGRRAPYGGTTGT